MSSFQRKVVFTKVSEIVLATCIFHCLMICHCQNRRNTVMQNKAILPIQVTSLSCLTPGMCDCTEIRTLLASI